MVADPTSPRGEGGGLTYISVCSGIEAATVAWHPLGWKPLAFAEIEKFPSAVLAHHYPDVPNYGDLTRYHEWPDDLAPDLIVGGTPCQSFSVAGLRAGLDDPRGNLALVFLGLVDRYRPRWVVWENVPGVRSSGKGRDLGAFLGALGELGYGGFYRSFDAQYFGLAQRRERVFVVGHLGDWRPPAAVLFEPESLRRHPAPSRAPRESVAGTLSSRSSAGGGLGTDTELAGGVQPYAPSLATCLGVSAASASSPNVASGQGTVVGTLTTRLANNAMGAPEVDAGHYLPWPAEVAPTLNAAFGDKQGLEDQHALGGAGLFVPSDVLFATSGQANAAFADNQSLALNATNEQPYIKVPTQGVRRLTPRECERLQGFPDDYTLIPLRNKAGELTGKLAADGPRYKALGNSMAVPVVRWIGRRIAEVDRLISPTPADAGRTNNGGLAE